MMKTMAAVATIGSSGKGDDTNNGDDGNDKIEWEGQRLKQWWYWR